MNPEQYYALRRLIDALGAREPVFVLNTTLEPSTVMWDKKTLPTVHVAQDIWDSWVAYQGEGQA